MFVSRRECIADSYVSCAFRIFTVPTLGNKLKQDSMALSYTPRRFVPHPTHQQLFYVIESEHRTLSPSTQAARVAMLGKELKPRDRGVLDLPPEEFGLVKGEVGQWASCVRVVAPLTGETTFKLELEGNEAAFSLAVVPFSSQDSEPYLVVGSAVDTHLAPRTSRVSYLTVYKITNEGRELEFVHKTEVDDVPLVVRAFQGRLLAGIGTALRIYDMGKKKLLRKCENKVRELSKSGAVIVLTPSS